MKIDKEFLGPSKLKLALTAALALVAATVAVWGVISHSGKVQRQNAEFAMTMTRMAPEPKWTAELSRTALLGALAAREALHDAGDLSGRLGLICGTASGGMALKVSPIFGAQFIVR